MYKVLKEGDLCQHCNTPVVRVKSKKRDTKRNQNYYFRAYLYCPNCKEIYMLEEEKVFIKRASLF